MTWEEYRDVTCQCREKICVNKAQLELKLERIVGDNKKRVFSNILIALEKSHQSIAEWDMKKAEVFNAFLAFIFNTEGGPRESQCPGLEDQDCGIYQLPVDGEIL